MIFFNNVPSFYMAERNWSEDQKIKYLGKGKIRFNFTASSEHELVAWLLSFGEDAKLLKPKWLVKEAKSKIEKMQGRYQIIKSQGRFPPGIH